MPTYTVLPGDVLAPIARRFGFADPDVVWNDPANRPLRDAGRTPMTLAPGDELFIPELQVRTLSGGTEQRFRARVKSRQLKLRIVLQQLGGKSLANASGSLKVGNREIAVRTDSNGKFEVPIEDGDEAAMLHLPGDGTTLHAVDIPLHIGHLDPVTTISGQRARLNNLGYRAGIASEAGAVAFRSAVEEFQCDQRLQVDGNCGPATQAKLRNVHGC